MRVDRFINLPDLLSHKSAFLFGARLTGKSTVIEQQLHGKATIVDLLDADTYLQASNDSRWLDALVASSPPHQLIVIDEVQRLPSLLNSVHQLIARKQVRFLLTGSSVRKLRRDKANFLGGRAGITHLFPLTWREIAHFNLERYLTYGGMPSVYLSQQPQVELSDYVLAYMREELLAEGFIRDLPPFRGFLQVIAQCNGEILNFTKLANDCQLSVRQVRTFVEILQDTLVAALLPPWRKGKKRKAIATSKLYLFDTGIARVAAGMQSIDRHSSSYGKCFEQFIWMELRAYLAYRRLDLHELNFWRTKHGQEVDFIVGDEIAVEVKASNRVSERDLKGLRALAEEGVFKNFYLVSNDRTTRRYEESCTMMYWEDFLTALWNDKLITN